jgi:hypothetical protein
MWQAFARKLTRITALRIGFTVRYFAADILFVDEAK